MKDVPNKVTDNALAVMGAEIGSRASQTRIANLPVIEEGLRAKLDQEMDRVFRSVTGPLRAILEIAGVNMGNVHIDWRYLRSGSSEVYDRLRGLQISLEARSKRPESEVV